MRYEHSEKVYDYYRTIEFSAGKGCWCYALSVPLPLLWLVFIALGGSTLVSLLLLGPIALTQIVLLNMYLKKEAEGRTGLECDAPLLKNATNYHRYRLLQMSLWLKSNGCYSRDFVLMVISDLKPKVGSKMLLKGIGAIGVLGALLLVVANSALVSIELKYMGALGLLFMMLIAVDEYVVGFFNDTVRRKENIIRDLDSVLDGMPESIDLDVVENLK
ncbi:MAG: hypothetical protein OCC49_05950 [Fibrobacterales bacterium]